MLSINGGSIVFEVHLAETMPNPFCSLLVTFCMYLKSAKVMITELMILLQIEFILTTANSPGFLKSSGSLELTETSTKQLFLIIVLVPVQRIFLFSSIIILWLCPAEIWIGLFRSFLMTTCRGLHSFW